MEHNMEMKLEATPEPSMPSPENSAKSKKRASPSKKPAGESPTKKAKFAKTNGATKIGTSLDELAPADRMMWKMKQEGKSWREIEDAWETITGKRLTGLPKRYTRLKASLARVKDEDMAVLKKAMAAADTQIEEEKKAAERKRWALVSAFMEDSGTEKYEHGTLEKAWKKIQDDGGAAIENGVDRSS